MQVMSLRSNADHPGVTGAALLACKGTGEPPVSQKKSAAISWWRGLRFPVRRGWCWGSPCRTMPIPVPTLTCRYMQLQPASLQPSAFCLLSPLRRHNLQKIELVYLSISYEPSPLRLLVGDLKSRITGLGKAIEENTEGETWALWDEGRARGAQRLTSSCCFDFGSPITVQGVGSCWEDSCLLGRSGGSSPRGWLCQALEHGAFDTSPGGSLQP